VLVSILTDLDKIVAQSRWCPPTLIVILRVRRKRRPRRMGACSGVPLWRFAPSQEEEGNLNFNITRRYLDAHFVGSQLTTTRIPGHYALQADPAFGTKPT
jgi:hypothetical protein